MVGDLIDKKRREVGLSRADLARKSKLTRQYISALCNNRRGVRPGAEAVIALAAALGVEPAFFFPEEATDVDTASRDVACA